MPSSPPRLVACLALTLSAACKHTEPAPTPAPEPRPAPSDAASGEEIARVCPEEAPDYPAACEGELHCEYDKQCCCGECRGGRMCTCDEGVMKCLWTEFCMLATCAEGCGRGEVKTAEGCRTCIEAGPSYAPRVAELAAGYAACKRDGDCLAVEPACGPWCPEAVNLGRVTDFQRALAFIEEGWCSQRGGGVCLAPSSCPRGAPRCVAGRCRMSE
jgi:hypothetical protein